MSLIRVDNIDDSVHVVISSDTIVSEAADTFTLSYDRNKRNMNIMIRDRYVEDYNLIGHSGSSPKFDRNKVSAKSHSMEIIVPDSHKKDQSLKVPKNLKVTSTNMDEYTFGMNFCEFHRRAILDYQNFQTPGKNSSSIQKLIILAMYKNSQGKDFIKKAKPIDDKTYYSVINLDAYKRILYLRRFESKGYDEVEKHIDDPIP